jgi:hypothetical protein
VATAPTENAGFEVARGSSTNTSILWNETTDKWTFTNDGTNYSDIGSAASESYANSAFVAANTADQRAVTSGVFANSAYSAANSASSYANAAFAAANASINFIALGTANSAASYANGAFLAANTADQKAVTSGSYANSAYGVANTAASYANGAFSAANTKLSTSGGTITGDLTINGNITVSGCTATLTVETLRVHDSIVDVAWDVTGVPALDAGIRVVRGDSNPVLLKWNESIDKWTFTNDGTIYSNIGSAAAEDYANSAFARANASVNFITLGTANSAASYANSAFAAANASANFITLGTANSASVYANAAYLHANAAFAAANTGGSATDTFARTQANAAFTQANAAVALYTGGLYQTRNYTGDNTTVNYTVSSTTTANSILVMENGVVQTPVTDYTLAGTTLTFTTAPTTGTKIQIRELSYGNQDATSAGVYANAAFEKANTGSSSSSTNNARSIINVYVFGS